MGITIHYSGRAMSSAALTEILTIAQMFAAGRGWQFALYEDPFGIMDDRDKDDPGWVEHEGPYRGIVICPHRNCEPLRLDFTIHNELTPASTKTQFAPFGVHKGIVALLREVERHFDPLIVEDASGLWESGDEATAKNRFEFLGRAIDAVADGLRADGHDVEGPGVELPTDSPYDFDEDGDWDQPGG